MKLALTICRDSMQGLLY